MVKEILKLGNPQLYEISEEISESEKEDVKVWIEDLHDTLMDDCMSFPGLMRRV